MKTYLALASLFLVGCGVSHRVSGGTENELVAETKVDVTITLKVDLTACEDLYYGDRLECIQAITGVFQPLGDLTKILVCNPEDESKCELLSKILGSAQ